MLIGLVGKTNSGKSTFFKAATLAEVEISNRPFVTLAPNRGIGFVKIKCVDKEFNIQCKAKEGYCLNNNRFVPVELLDVAGLVPGSHLGKGLGLQFLDDLRQADMFIHIIDISGSTDEQGNPVSPLSYDPLKDVKFLENEIDMWYLSILKKGWDKFTRQLKAENLNIKASLAKQLSGLKVTEEDVEDVIKELKLQHNPSEWSKDDLFQLASSLRKKTKPMIIAANKIDVPGSLLNLDKLKKAFPDYIIVPCSSESELALKEAAKHELIEYIPGENNFKILKEEALSNQQKKALEFIKENVLKKYKSTGLQEALDTAVFKLLKQIAVYPVANAHLEDKDGRKLPDCYLVPEHTNALQLAFKIHTDIGNNFIKAIDLKSKQVIGKDHLLKNNDVVEIITK